MHSKIIILSILLGFLCNAQKANNDVPFYFDKSSFNLKDSVKTVKFRHAFFRKGLTSRDKTTFYLMRDTKYNAINAFYPNGLLWLDSRAVPDSVFMEITPNNRAVTEYRYDEKDIVSKKALKIKHKFYYPLSDDNLLRVTSHNLMNYHSTQSTARDLFETLYKCTPDEKKRIKETVEYSPSHLDDTIPSGKILKEDIWLRMVNYYNEKDLVIKQKPIRGPKDDFDSSFEFSYESTGFCDDLELRYQYDNQDRMTQALLYGCGKIIMQEDYTYNKKDDYVEQVNYYMDGKLSRFVLPTKRFIKTFNPKGDVIETRYIPDYEGQSNLKMRTHYYTYEYDKHKNWIKCSMYLEGTKEGEPTMIAERQIEYYK